LDALNARANAAALANGNGHLLQNPITAIFSQQQDSSDSSNAPGSVVTSENGPNNTLINNNGLLADMLTANLIMAASSSGTSGVTTATATAVTGAGAAVSRKWSREDRKQKEMETKMALMLSATQLPMNIIENSFFREFMEYHYFQILNTQHARTVVNLKNHLAVAKKIAIMIDVLKLNTPTTSASLTTGNDDKEESKDSDSKDSTSENSDSGFDASSENQSGAESPKSSSAVPIEEMRPLVRLCISAAFYSPLVQRMDVALLGVRTLADQPSMLDAVKNTVEQVLAEFEITSSKVSRYLCNGICELIGKDVSLEDIFPQMVAKLIFYSVINCS
uniref:Thyroid hormone receptor-associated protein complex subunit n=1 Tax=Gongylonema pulchrum TaxID=637853 RepID=A0A183ED41_9BILA